MAAGKRPILAFSTRVLLLFVFICGLGYVLSEHTPYHEILGTGALILNVMFIGFALIDYVTWQKEKLPR
jgi:hypothetical protein